MKMKRLGRTGLMVTENSFGALPLQRRSVDDAVAILRRAYDHGINFYDTARAYSDSEFKIGKALGSVRKNIVIATKTAATTKQAVTQQLEASLKELNTDYIDLYQLHNPSRLPDPEDPQSSYAALKEARQKGLIRFFGITNHRLESARQALNSGLYDTLQFPLSYLSNPTELKIASIAKEKDVGFIAMKALSGGLLTNARACFAFFSQYDNIVPIWGIQDARELDEFMAAANENVRMTPEYEALIGRDRKALSGEFCRGCGYCEPCPAGIKISWCARMDKLLTRAVWQNFITDEWRAEMDKIDGCTLCGSCKLRCPYGLDCPGLVAKQLANYNEFYKTHIKK